MGVLEVFSDVADTLCEAGFVSPVAGMWLRWEWFCFEGTVLSLASGTIRVVVRVGSRVVVVD